MPVVENEYRKLEREQSCRGPCVIFTLESILGQVLGMNVIAPAAVFDVREAHIIKGHQELDLIRSQFLGPSNLRELVGRGPVSQIIDASFSRILSAEPEQIIGEVIPTWIDTDPQLAGILRTLQFDFVDASYGELVSLAGNGLPVGMVISYYRKPYHPIAHIFHIGAENDVRFVRDLSDFGDLKQEIQQLIYTGEITDLVEAARNAAGFSGLVVRS